MTLNWQVLPYSALTRDQLYAMLKLRQDVFIVEQNCPYHDIDGDDVNWLHVLGEQAGRLVAYARLRLTDATGAPIARIGRVIVTVEARHQGVARQLMLRAIDEIHQQAPNRPIALAAQTYLLPFYQSLGFANVGEPYLEDDIPHQDMEWHP